MGSCIKKLDLITHNITDRLHFEKSNHHKTVIGGLGTLLAFIGLFFIAISKGYQIFNYEDPYINSQKVPVTLDSK